MKHVGKTDRPEIRFNNDNPKFYTGLCPRGISDALKEALLEEAVADGPGDREIDFPKRLFVVHDGTIYRAETTDWGKSYHAYPYRGKMGRALLARMSQMAAEKGCQKSFDDWVNKHIEQHGK